MYKSNKEIEQDFDEKVSTYDKDGGFRVYIEDYDNIDLDVELIKSHIAQIRQNDLKGLVEWAEKQEPSIGIIAASGMSSEATQYMNGYLKLRSEIINHLSSLNQVNE